MEHPAPERFRPDWSLERRVAVITGGSRGIGRAIAWTLANAGAAVVLGARKEEELRQAADEFAERGLPVAHAVADVTDAEQVSALIELAWQQFGGADVLVNAAGTNWSQPPEAIPEAAWEKVMSTNLTGAFLASQAVARRWLAERRGGVILNVASVAGLISSDPELMDTLPYNVSKAGLVMLTRDLARKWARRDIRVNALAPGFFPSKMTRNLLAIAGDAIAGEIPMSRVGELAELAGPTLLLCSSAGSYITGQTLVVDGGMLA